MNSQFMSQQPPSANQGYGPPSGASMGVPPMSGPPMPSQGMQHPGQMGVPPGAGPSAFNGPSMPLQGQRPPGPPGTYGPPAGKVPLSGPTPNSVSQHLHNGPNNGPAPGPQGDQFNRQPPAGQFPGSQMVAPGPQQMSHMGPVSSAAPMAGPPPPTSQMGTMNLSGAPPRMGMTGHPPNNAMMGGAARPPSQPGQPPNSMYMPNSGAPPPSSMGGQSMGPPSMGPTPSSMAPPPSSMGPPHTTMGAPSMGPLPSSMGAVAPPSSSMAGPGMNAATYPGVPPPGLGGFPGANAGPPRPGMPPPPTSYQNQMPPMTGHSGMQPAQFGGPPSGPTGGMPPPPGPGGIHPPPGQGGMAPPPGPGAVHPPPGPGGMHPLPGQGGMAPPPGPGVMHPPPGQAGMPPPPGSGGMPPPPGPGGMQQNMPGPGTYPPPPGPGGMPPPAVGAQPGFGPASPPGMAGPGAMPPQQQQQPRRLDPDQMPSPIQVIDDDKKTRAGVFQTGQRGIVPPLVTTDFTSEDQGTCAPNYMRSTMYNIPCTSEMLKQSNIPFALTISPFARIHNYENPMPLVDLGQLGPVRCNRCKAYMCPMMQFVDGGRKFQCSFCTCQTEVPPEYFAHLDHTGRRVDTYDRPELYLGAYEFVATEDYCKNNKLPKPAAFIFMIDVSYNAVKNGLVHLLCDRLKEEILPNLPKEAGADESEIRVGFVTYAKDLHFYNIKGSLAQPQMMVVSDTQDVFVPLLDGFLVKVSESEAIIETLLQQLPHMFAESRETEIVLGPVIQAGMDALKSAECPGKLLIFHSSLPVAEAPGKLKNRDNRGLLGTDKEKTILTPQIPFYTKLGQECVAVGCGVDLFLFPNAYIDIATIAETSRATGGTIYKYQYFQADLDGDRFIEDLKSHVSRPIAFDAIMRVRTSTGIRPVDFLGNFYMSNTTDVELANMDCEAGITVEVKHDDKLTEADGACVQAAVLYTSCSGQRRLRILNQAFNTCTQMADLFRNCELDTLVNFMSKNAIRGCLNAAPKEVREGLMNRCAHVLACYRKNCASPSSAGQLILPECMKLLPLYSNCIIKSKVMQGGSEISVDDRSYLTHLVNGMGVSNTHAFFYPRLIPLHDIDMDSTEVPASIRCSYERLKDNGAYLIEDGLSMLIWVGMNINTEWIQEVFGVHSATQIDIDKTTLQDLDSSISRRIRGIIKNVREQRHRHLKLTIVRQRDKLEPVFQGYLMEDRGASGSASYVDFLCHIHKEIRSLLS